MHGYRAERETSVFEPRPDLKRKIRILSAISDRNTHTDLSVNRPSGTARDKTASIRHHRDQSRTKIRIIQYVRDTAAHEQIRIETIACDNLRTDEAGFIRNRHRVADINTALEMRFEMDVSVCAATVPAIGNNTLQANRHFANIFIIRV